MKKRFIPLKYLFGIVILLIQFHLKWLILAIISATSLQNRRFYTLCHLDIYLVLHRYTETDSTDYWWFEKQENKPNYYKGRIGVLINGGCFSTTGHLLALMREYKIGTFYGEYSQGSNYSNSGGQAFVLPYSKTLVWIPTFQYKMRTPQVGNDLKGIKPAFEIQIEPKDLKTKYDSQLDFVIKKMEQNK
ncbi:MAG: hypothetical protein IPL35_01620 [Sphingobacteriales bacterium]|nr:hypothetical protein [Sphingobacteriales bacterium]